MSAKLPAITHVPTVTPSTTCQLNSPAIIDEADNPIIKAIVIAIMLALAKRANSSDFQLAIAPNGKTIANSTTTGLNIVLNQLGRSEEHTSELQSRPHLVCRL